jgi:hypothetical protein
MNRVYLRICVEYDPTRATADRIAEALDLLIGTALSTSGGLDDCGPVHVGSFDSPAESDDALVIAARQEYSKPGVVEIDERPHVSGDYVSAWVRPESRIIND